ncbi:MAG: hypothetical protein AB1540_16625 [Bdellovibrionota bacterium]
MQPQKRLTQYIGHSIQEIRENPSYELEGSWAVTNEYSITDARVEGNPVVFLHSWDEKLKKGKVLDAIERPATEENQSLIAQECHDTKAQSAAPIALAIHEFSKEGSVAAKRVWRINMKNKQLEETSAESVSCEVEYVD